MASISIPPPAGPTSTRLDWGHTGERSSAAPRGSNRGRSNANRSDRGRGGRGGRRGGTSARGARGRNSPPTEKTMSAPPIVSAPSQTSTASKNSSSSSLPKPLPGVDLPERPKGGPERAPQHAVDKLPTLTVEPASPTSAPQSASTTSSKMSTRHRRAHNKQSRAPRSSENSTTGALASTVNARKSRSGPSSPHPKASPSRNAPPHLSASPAPTVASSSAKSNIDSLVEHVRALAMDHRPSTPNSHIDWADEDDSLPDLEDWGVPSNPVVSAKPDPSTTASIEKAQLELMSPILDDSLKQLPQSFDKTSPSPSVGSGTLSPNIANRALVLLVNGPGDGDGVAEASLPLGVDKLEDHSPGLPEPSSQSDPVPPPTNPLPLDSSHPPEQAPVLDTEPSKDTPPHLPVPTSEPPVPVPTSSITPPIDSSQPGRGLADSIHAHPCAAPAPAPVPPEARGTEPVVDANIKGSTASVDALAPQSSETEIGALEGPRKAPPPPRNPMHGRSHTVGRPSPFSTGGKRSFFSGSSTPVGVAAAKGPHHGRTQSSPVTHRRQHSRPIITMDGMARLAKTLGTALPKREVAATNSATSSE